MCERKDKGKKSKNKEIEYLRNILAFAKSNLMEELNTPKEKRALREICIVFEPYLEKELTKELAKKQELKIYLPVEVKILLEELIDKKYHMFFKSIEEFISYLLVKWSLKMIDSHPDILNLRKYFLLVPKS